MKLGIFLQTLGNNQLAVESIATINTLLTKRKDIFPSFFFKEVEPIVIKPRTIATQFDKIYNYNGHLITTSLDTTHIALQCRRLKSINFVVNDLEWTFDVGNYIINSNLYRNERINLFSPSKEYAVALENYCNVKPTIIRGFNINEIITSIQQRN